MMWHNFFNDWLIFALIHIVALVSPGPDFFIILRQSLQQGRLTGIITSTGIAFGNFMHFFYVSLSTYALVKVNLIDWMPYFAAIYLIYLGLRGMKSHVVALFQKLRWINPQALSEKLTDSAILSEFQKNDSPPINLTKAFFTGFFINALNPKAFLFFLAVFNTVMMKYPITMQFIFVLYVVVMCFLWFAFVSFFLTQTHIRAVFLKHFHWVDLGISILLISFGAFILFSFS